MKAAIYARYSSGNQRESSLEDQVRLCREEAARRGYTVVEVFSDAELSGARDDRPGFVAVLQAAERRTFDVLMVDDISRLSRDTADALHTLKRLQFWGVGLVSRDGIDTTNGAKGSTLLYGMRSVIAEEFLRDLSMKTHRGLQGAALRGHATGGKVYGYRSEPAGVEGTRLVIYPPEAAVVRRIFELRVGDGESRPLSLREIALRLNADRIPPPGQRWKGRSIRQCATWSFTAVRGLVINPRYSGRVVWNKAQMVRHPDTRKRLRRRRPRDEWIMRTDESLRIIPEDLWERTQARMAEVRFGLNGTALRMKNRKFLLSGLLRCGTCGANYIMSTGFSYKCGAHRNRGPAACHNGHAVSRRRLERAIVDALRTHLYTPANLGPLVEVVRQDLLDRAKRAGDAGNRDRTQSSLVAIEKEIANIKAAVLRGKATDTLLEMLEAKTRERDALAIDVDRSDNTQDFSQRLGRTLDRLPQLVDQAIRDLHTLLAVEQVDKGKTLLAMLVSEIILHPVDGHLEAEVRGNLEGLLKLQPPTGGPRAALNTVGSGGRI